MFKRTIFAFLTMLAAGAILAQAYKWMDEDGIVHYSDRPQKGAVEMQLPTDGINAPPVSLLQQRRGLGRSADAVEEVQAFKYESLVVAAPGAEETLWNIEGVLNVMLSVTPALQVGHRIRVYFDGSPRVVTTTSFQIAEVYRGAHKIQAEIIDRSGTLLIRSAGHEFYVQQTSINRGN
jgi:hypothetical protein